jgi:hypothetical protein
MLVTRCAAHTVDASREGAFHKPHLCTLSFLHLVAAFASGMRGRNGLLQDSLHLLPGPAGQTRVQMWGLHKCDALCS